MTKKRYKKLMRAYWTRMYIVCSINQSPYITKDTINKIIKSIDTHTTRYCASLTRDKIIDLLGVREFLKATENEQ